MEYNASLIAKMAFAPYLGAIESDQKGPEYLAMSALQDWLGNGEDEDLRAAVRSAVIIPCGDLPPVPLTIAGNIIRRILDQGEVADEVRARSKKFADIAQRLEPAMSAAQQRGELTNRAHVRSEPIDQYRPFRALVEELEQKNAHRKHCEELGAQALADWAGSDTHRKRVLASLKQLYIQALANGLPPAKLLKNESYRDFLPSTLVEVISQHGPIQKILSRDSRVWRQVEQMQLQKARQQMQDSSEFKVWSGQSQHPTGRLHLSEETWTAIGQAVKAAATVANAPETTSENRQLVKAEPSVVNETGPTPA